MSTFLSQRGINLKRRTFQWNQVIIVSGLLVLFVKMNRLLLFHRVHILFTQNRSEIPCSVKLAPSSRIRRHDPQISLLSIPFIIFSFLAKPSPIPPTLRPLPYHTHDPPCADMGSSSKDHRAKPDEGEREGEGDRNLKSFFPPQTGPKTSSLPTS